MIDERLMLPIGTLLQDGKYRVVRYIASGGFGNTYVVEHVKLHKLLALKEFYMRGVNSRNGLIVTVSVDDNRDAFEQMREKFYKEAQRLAQLDESHIVEVSDFFEENSTAYYTMRLIDGESLAAKMKRSQQPLNENDVCLILPQVLQALRRVHSQGIYHLDLKPGNIMCDADGHCYIIDFGASKQFSTDQNQTLSTSTGLCYTPGFAPSEQVSGNVKRIGPWTDLYALGATLYNLLTNKMPPSPDDIINDGNEVFHFPIWVSSRMRHLIVWLMSPRATDRPQTVDDVMWRLRQHDNETVVSEQPSQSAFHEELVQSNNASQATRIRPSVETRVGQRQMSPDNYNEKNDPGGIDWMRAWGVAITIVIIFYLLVALRIF